MKKFEKKSLRQKAPKIGGHFQKIEHLESSFNLATTGAVFFKVDHPIIDQKKNFIFTP